MTVREQAIPQSAAGVHDQGPAAAAGAIVEAVRIDPTDLRGMNELADVEDG